MINCLDLEGENTSIFACPPHQVSTEDKKNKNTPSWLKFNSTLCPVYVLCYKADLQHRWNVLSGLPSDSERTCTISHTAVASESERTQEHTSAHRPAQVHAFSSPPNSVVACVTHVKYFMHIHPEVIKVKNIRTFACWFEWNKCSGKCIFS